MSQNKSSLLQVILIKHFVTATRTGPRLKSKGRNGMAPEIGAKTWMFLWLVSINHFMTFPNHASWSSHNPRAPESQLSFQDVSFLPICLQWTSRPCATLPGFCGQCLLCQLGLSIFGYSPGTAGSPSSSLILLKGPWTQIPLPAPYLQLGTAPSAPRRLVQLSLNIRSSVLCVWGSPWSLSSVGYRIS